MLRAQSLCGDIALFSAATQAAKFTSPKGFAIEYPDSWKVASKAVVEARTTLTCPKGDRHASGRFCRRRTSCRLL